MKQQFWVGAVSCVITLIITFGFNALTNRYSEDKGRVVIGSPITVSGALFSEMQIENWSSKPLDGLVLVVPSSVSLSSITASFPISIEEVKGFSGSQASKRITFSGIPPHRIARIMIPLSAARDIDDFHLPNVETLDLETLWNDYSEDPVQRERGRTIFVSICYALFVGLCGYLMSGWLHSILNKEHKKTESMIEDYKKKTESMIEDYNKMIEDHNKKSEEDKKRMEEFRAQYEKIEVKNTKMEKETKELRTTQGRLRLYLLSRLSDYSKELEFWRDTIRRILYTGGLGEGPTDLILKSVSASLHTYSTQGGAADHKDNFDSIMEQARIP